MQVRGDVWMLRRLVIAVEGPQGEGGGGGGGRVKQSCAQRVKCKTARFGRGVGDKEGRMDEEARTRGV